MPTHSSSERYLPRCICRLMALSGHAETVCCLSAFGGKADITSVLKSYNVESL